MPRGVKRKDPAARPAVERGIPVAVVDILLSVIPVDEEQFTLDTTIVGDLGADSLDLAELAMDLEAQFGVVVDDAMVETWETGTIAGLLADLRRLGAIA